MALQTIVKTGCFDQDVANQINANFAVAGSTAGNTHITGTLTVDGASTLTGNVAASGTLAVTGAATAASVTATGVVKGSGVTLAPVAITADGAISKSASANYMVTKAGIAVLTLAAPTATTDDGVIITVTSTTTNAHTITATSLLNNGGAGVPYTTATFAAHAGATITLCAYQALWYVIAVSNVTLS